MLLCEKPLADKVDRFIVLSERKACRYLDTEAPTLSIAASGSMSSSTASATPALIGSKRRRCGDGRVGVRGLACDWSVLLRGVACRLSRGLAWKYSEMTGMLDRSGSSSTRGCTFE